MSEQTPEDEQWTDAARERFRAAGAALVEALRAHSAALLPMTGRRADVAEILAAGDRLALAADEYSDAQFEFTGTSPRWERIESDDDDRDEELPRQEPAGAITVLHRADYRVMDVAAVMNAGRLAYREVWPDDTAEDAAVDVADFSRAIYQVMHAGGIAALDETPGLEPAGAFTSITEADTLLDDDPAGFPEHPFILADPT
ncbi:MAG TPA: hypothetical protein VMU51_09385 [Mycobacteriales bacterium]|nr:hypothetical protein [Mycobacteriales bacterium]